MAASTRFVQLAKAGVSRQKAMTIITAAAVILCVCGFFAFEAIVGLGKPGAATNEYRPSKVWHFAAGSTVSGMRTSLYVLNPGDGEAKATIGYFLPDGEPLKKDLVVPARSGLLVDCMQDLSGRQLVFGMSINSDRPVVVSREMYNLSPGYAVSSVEQGMGAARSEWYFAEGSTSETRKTVLYILNDGDSTAGISITRYNNNGAGTETSTTLEPRRSYVLDAGSIFTASDDASFAVVSDEPVFAERYFETLYQGLRVGCCTPGNPGIKQSDDVIIPPDALLARVEILNPGLAGSTVELQYHLPTGIKKTAPFDVEGNSRRVVSLDDPDLGPGPDVLGKAGLWVTVRVIRGNDVAVESTSFGSSSECWVWASVGTGGRRADEGPVYIPVVNNPCYRENLVVANVQNGTVTATVVERSTKGKAESGKKTDLKPGRCLSAASLSTNSPFAWYEAYIPDSEGVAWRLVSNRAFNCLTVDKAAIALASGPLKTRGADTTANKVALTFDVENDPKAAVEVLDQLKVNQAPAAFFVLGEFAKSHPEIVRRMAREGHELGNLTYTHLSYTMGNAEVVSEIERTDSLVTKITGAGTKPYMRLPYGTLGTSLLEAVNQAGYAEIAWNVDPTDWAALPPDEVVTNAMNEVKPGSIILLYAANAQQKALELPMLIKAIRDRGLEIAPLTEVLFLGRH